jgi:hypothetical protein
VLISFLVKGFIYIETFKVYLIIRRCTLNIEIRRSLKLKSKEEFTLLYKLLIDLIKLPLLLIKNLLDITLSKRLVVTLVKRKPSNLYIYNIDKKLDT